MGEVAVHGSTVGLVDCWTQSWSKAHMASSGRALSTQPAPRRLLNAASQPGPGPATVTGVEEARAPRGDKSSRALSPVPGPKIKGTKWKRAGAGSLFASKTLCFVTALASPWPAAAPYRAGALFSPRQPVRSPDDGQRNHELPPVASKRAFHC